MLFPKTSAGKTGKDFFFFHIPCFYLNHKIPLLACIREISVIHGVVPSSLII